MKETKERKSTETEGPGTSDAESSCCGFENMAQMIQKFCGGKEGGFDCCTMMEKMCGMGSKESKKA